VGGRRSRLWSGLESNGLEWNGCGWVNRSIDRSINQPIHKTKQNKEAIICSYFVLLGEEFRVSRRRRRRRLVGFW
jgi:hypothetical protein